ncbi:MAG: DUF3465 domain-containing protein [Bacteroidota bacterium]
MSRNPQMLLLLAALASLVGCGTPAVAPIVTNVSTLSILESKAVPAASAFVTVSGTVKQVLPMDTQGLTHQNFMFTGKDGKIYRVNNSTTHGMEVPNLKVGLALTIKGTTYKDGKTYGLHWTHHADKPGDAGWIKTSDGKIYE